MNIKYVAYVDFDDRSGEFDQGLIGRLNVDKLLGDNKDIYQEWINGSIEAEEDNVPVMISSGAEVILGVYQQKGPGYELSKDVVQSLDFKLTEIFDTEKEAIRSFCKNILKYRKSFFDGMFAR